MRTPSLLLLCILLGLARVGSFIGAAAEVVWQSTPVPTGPPKQDLQKTLGWIWYRAWLKPHDSFFTPHERNLFAESVNLNIRNLAGAHEVFINGTRIGSGGGFPPQYRDGIDGNYRHKVTPGLLKKGQWNEIALRIYHPEAQGGFHGEAPFIMDYFNECVLEGEWEWLGGDGSHRTSGPRPDRPSRGAFDQYHESNRVLGRTDSLVPGPRKSPADSWALMKPADDLQVDLLLSEPLVAQPTHFSFDARGRLWVAQYRQYPYPAGVKMLSRDKYYRAQYDRVPAAPPHHEPGHDRITVHEDNDGDGLPDKHTVFVDGLNMANAVLPGRDGVWVMNTPYLLFYPDRNGDDVPDGPPVVHLAGFGLEDTHSVANGLVWGPDGWIYGGQGSTTTSRVVRPGIDPEGSEGVYFEGCMVWRYHPQTRAYELFAEGSGNVFGLELDGEGRLFSGHNGAETRGWHYQQGGYYLKQGADPGKFGPPRNPYTFGQLPWMKSDAPIQRFTHILSVVEGSALPASRQGQLFWLDPLHNLVLASDRHPLGSTFGTHDLGNVLQSGDEAFRPVYIANAPDGSVYIADFYEHYIAHGQHYQSQIDPTTGRLYRLRGRNAPLARDVRLDRKTPQELMDLLSHPNRWHRLMAARVLGQKATPAVVEELNRRLVQPEAPIAALWALHEAGSWNDDLVLRMLSHPSPLLREWTVRLAGDKRQVSPMVLQALVQLARTEPNVRVRTQLASSFRRLPSDQALIGLAALLTRDEDVKDPCQPLFCWWILETHLTGARESVLDLFKRDDLWARPLVQEAILPRLMRRWAQQGRRQDLLDCAWLLERAPSDGGVAQLLKGFEEAFRGRDLAGMPEELVKALSRSGRASLSLRVRQHEAEALKQAMLRIQDPQVPLEERLLLMRVLSEVRATGLRQPLLDLVKSSQPDALRQAGLLALSSEEDPLLAEPILQLLPHASSELRVSVWTFLVSRPAWSLALLDALVAGRVEAKNLPSEITDRLRRSNDPTVRQRAVQLFPVVSVRSKAVAQRIQELEAILRKSPGNPYAGETLFGQRCASCHTLFYKGGKVGPDLTAYQRDHLGTLLNSILDPSAEIREGYAAVEVETQDGRVLSGFLTDRDARVTTLRGLDGQDHVLQASEIRLVQPTGRSLMPEGLLDGLTEDQLRDLFAFLRSSQPFTR